MPIFLHADQTHSLAKAIEAGKAGFDSPEEAVQFVQWTGVGVLAPAVGNMHGMVKSTVQGKTKKRLNIERTAEIKKAAGVFLTLHGGSGTDDEDFQKAIAAGMNIIHINTELGVAWRHALESGWPGDTTKWSPTRFCGR